MMGMQHPVKLLLPLGILILVAVTSWYVLSRPVPPKEEPTGITQKGETTEHIVETGLYHEIDAAYPGKTKLKDEANIAAVAIMRNFLEEDIATFKEQSGLNALTAEDIEIMGLGGDRRFAYASTYHSYTSPRTVSYVFDIYVDTMGAHPNGFHKTFTFDLESGAALGIWSLFEPSDAYLDILPQIARRELPERIATKAGIPVSEVDTDYIASGTEPTQFNYDDFYLDGDTLVIIFQPYRVGPWVIGTQELPIPRTELVNILRSEYR